MGETAWHGTVCLHEAKWTDNEGSTVTFKLPMNDELERQRNPFQKFTKRRSGKAGTRFMMICVDMKSRQSVYEDEVMLAGWNDSQSSGHTAKFWLCSDVLGHPFEGFERKVDSFFISLVELDDDNETIDQKMRDRVESKKKSPSQRLSFVAAMFCKNPEFWSFVGADGELGAAEYVRETCGIESRGQLDKEDDAARKFHELIRKPFTDLKTSYRGLF